MFEARVQADISQTPPDPRDVPGAAIVDVVASSIDVCSLRQSDFQNRRDRRKAHNIWDHSEQVAMLTMGPDCVKT
jgi:hypothetical protein